MRRDDEKEKTYFRSDRLFTMNGQWYFASREGDQRPYATREAAQRDLGQFTSERLELTGFQESRDREPKFSKVTSLAVRLREREQSRVPTLDLPELLI